MFRAGALRRLLVVVSAATAMLTPVAFAHGNHDQEPLGEGQDQDWSTMHMREEHHFNNFDIGAFFFLHDFDDDGAMEGSEIQRMYGLEDDSNRDASDEVRRDVVDTVLGLFDSNKDGRITLTELREGWNQGKRLPDFGLGPGHHGDDEYEYEIHHYEKYHDENTTEEDLIHPEDIAHFKKHEEMEAAQRRLDMFDLMEIVEENIPAKFRRG